MSKWDENVQGFLRSDERSAKMDETYRDAERAVKSQYEYDHYNRSDEPSDARIQSQLGYMTERLMIIQKTFAELQNRLESILMPDIEDDRAEVASPPRKMASEMSNTIDDLNGQISRLQNRMEQVIQRIQL